MSYKNGKDVLPEHLLVELQQYIQGELIYVPKREQKRAGWGENNGTRTVLKQRNHEILSSYEEGATIMELIAQYHLSHDSIRKIIMKTRAAAVGGAESASLFVFQH